MTTTRPGVVIRSSVFCEKCGDEVEATKNDRTFRYCKCSSSWVKGFESLKGRNTSIMADKSGQLYWEF